MHPFYLYLLQVGIALALFYILYACLLRGDTFLQLRRFYFLSAMVFSLVYPLFSVPSLSHLWGFSAPALADAGGEVTVTFGEPGWGITESKGGELVSAFPWKWWVTGLYVGVASLLFFRLLIQFVSIYRLRARSDKRLIRGIPVRLLKENTPPFSFFNMIFVHPDRHTERELDQILMHEQTHAKQCHSIDVVLIELLCAGLWWNPFVWLLKREITMNVEYLADQEVLREGVDCKEYQYHLLRLTYPETGRPIGNNFNVSRLKQRVIMMNKTKSPASRAVKYLAVLPLLFLLIAANSVYGANHDQSDPPPQKLKDGVLKLEDGVFVQVDNVPEFPGGPAAMMKFLADNIRYPVIAQENGIQGRVICSLVIDEEGNVTKPRVLWGVDPSLDAEVLRILNLLPKWKPGMHEGKPVSVWAVMPVVFRLQGDEPQDPLLSQEDKEALRPDRMDVFESDEGLIFDELVVVGYGSPNTNKRADDEEEFIVVDEQPIFPGGTQGMMKFLGENTIYPLEAQEKGIQGRVICNFLVMRDGSIRDINIVRGIDPLLDAEAVRVIGEMPKWIPGKMDDKPVNVRFTLPIVFRLTPNEATE